MKARVLSQNTGHGEVSLMVQVDGWFRPEQVKEAQDLADLINKHLPGDSDSWDRAKDNLADLPLNEKGEPHGWDHALAIIERQSGALRDILVESCVIGYDRGNATIEKLAMRGLGIKK